MEPIFYSGTSPKQRSASPSNPPSPGKGKGKNAAVANNALHGEDEGEDDNDDGDDDDDDEDVDMDGDGDIKRLNLVPLPVFAMLICLPTQWMILVQSDRAARAEYGSATRWPKQRSVPGWRATRTRVKRLSSRHYVSKWEGIGHHHIYGSTTQIDLHYLRTNMTA